MLSPRRVQQLAKDGVIPKAERGRFELAPAVQGYVRYLQERAAAAPDGGSVDYMAEKARKTKAEADLAEMAAAERRGALVEADMVGRAWAGIMREVQANLLGQAPARIASLILGETSEARVKRVIRDEITLALEAAADSDVKSMVKVVVAGISDKDRDGRAGGASAAA